MQVAALAPDWALDQYLRTVWTTEDGLPQNSVNAIQQTRDGYLWLATFGGLARFDGVRFTVFDASTPGLPSSRLLSLAEDRAGALWIGTEDAGLARFDGASFATYDARHGLPPGEVWTLFEDRQGAVWAGTSGGLARLRGERFERLTEADGVPEGLVLALTETRDGELWVGTSAGAAHHRDGRFVPASGLPDPWVYDLAEDSQGTLWALTRAGLARWNGSRFVSALRLPSLTQAVASLLADPAGGLWFTHRALHRWRDERDEVLDLAAGLAREGLRALFLDREGNLWVGTDGRGLLRLRDGAFLSFSTAEGLAGPSVLPISEDAGGTLWIGALCGGLARASPGGGFEVVARRPDGRPWSCVSTLLAEPDGGLWVGDGEELVRLAGSRSRIYRRRDGLPPGRLRALLRDDEGALWIGTSAGLARLADGVFRTYTSADGLVDDDVLVLHRALGGGLWIGTRHGLSRLEDGAFHSYTRGDGLPHDHVRALYEDADATLWIGMYGGGLARLRDGVFTAYGRAQGLPDSVVSAIVEDERGRLWLSSNRGILMVSRAALGALAAGAPLPARLFGVADGMRSAECNGGGQPSAWRAHDGRLWFPTVQGAVVVDPRRVPLPAPAPPVHIEEVRVAGEHQPVRGELAVAPGADLEIRYAALGLRSPERLRFRYRLEGFEDDWQDAGPERSVRYTNLPPGRYRFQVVAANDEGVWSPQGASLALAQRPRFHQTAWFAVLCVVGLAAAVALFERLRLSKLAERQRQLERLVDERTRSLVEAQESTRQSLLRLQASEGELRRLNEHLEQLILERTVELREARDVAIFTLAKLAELRDGTTGRHLERIAAFSQLLAATLRERGIDGIDEEFVEQIYRSSPLHDIGKVAIPDAVLRKPSGLTEEEERLMRLHTTIGGDVLSTVIERHGGRSLLHMAMEIAYSHHERWDGGGYPRGLAGDEIPLPARIVAVVDAYDAIISPRPYKPRISHDEAVRRIADERGTHFDPRLVDAFLGVADDFQRITTSFRG